ncbi:MAG: exodeoxyribonuclease V subunit beta [Candidatus Dasytiphilus stammeri]
MILDSKQSLLDAVTIPLYDKILIEASAGTGKTYTISILYIRLLLGLREVKIDDVHAPLSVNEILVVTFTEAATVSLKNIIRYNIHEFRIACIRENSKNKQFMRLLAEINDLKKAAALLLIAEEQMDNAAIFTIHSFCKRMLYLNAMEAGVWIEQELIEDDYELQEQKIVDFWNHHFSLLPKNIVKEILEEWSSPNALLKIISPWLKGEVPKLKYPVKIKKNIIEEYKNILINIDFLKKEWLLVASQIKKIIQKYYIYNTFSLSRWINKITEWAKIETNKTHLPRELKYFSYKFLLEKISDKKLSPPCHKIFKIIDYVQFKIPSLREWIFIKAINELRDTIKKEKKKLFILGFDDLLEILDDVLQKETGKELAKEIRSRYPVAFIDEFQDTDSQQYRIFNNIYSISNHINALVMIGDPKQAIYSFRGADIFAYMKVKATINRHYTLNTNWRSSFKMIDSINQIFSCIVNPFLFREIPFIPIHTASINHTLDFTINDKPQKALRFCFYSQKIDIQEYQQLMARYCAYDIKKWLLAGAARKAKLININNDSRILQASDIVILVRNHSEAKIMQSALNNINIPSIYLSNRESIFSTTEAREILYLLKAICTPEKSRLIRAALATSIFGLNVISLKNIFNKKKLWDYVIKEFSHYRDIWKQYGILPMFYELIFSNQVATNLLTKANIGNKQLTNILHIIELLQKESVKINCEYNLIKFLEQQIVQPNNRKLNQQLRLVNDLNVVQIVSIHKSKGLEYPIVWLPFIANFRKKNQYLYHDRHNYQKIIDLHHDIESKKLANEERLAEDLRLLYVALTRSILHCSIGIAPLIKNKKEKNTDVHHGALGYLLQRGNTSSAEELNNILHNMQSAAIELNNIIMPDMNHLTYSYIIHQKEKKHNYQNKFLMQKKNKYKLQDSSKFRILDKNLSFLPKLNLDATYTILPDNKKNIKSIHTFPRDVIHSIFLHHLLKEIDFSHSINWLADKIKQYGIDSEWIPIIYKWINVIKNILIDNNNLRLSSLKKEHKKTAFHFLLPINDNISVSVINDLIQSYDTLSSECSTIEFNQLNNMSTGFLDLFFLWEHKYYFIDYKTHWLGFDYSSYNEQTIKQLIKLNRYDIQYQLYTLALHRYLRCRLLNYNYEKHFGGIYYLFLRGMREYNIDNRITNNYYNGIFKIRPNIALIMALDKIFSI